MSKRPLSKKNYDHLAVNERLLVAGVLGQFDAAASRRDRNRMIAMLKRVDLSERYAAQWVDTLLQDHNFYRHWTDEAQNDPSRRNRGQEQVTADGPAE